jgi:hypothetical protein
MHDSLDSNVSKTPRDFCAATYCAVGHQAHFDPIATTLRLVITLTDRGHTVEHRIDAQQVTSFQWSGPPTEMDGHFELSTVEMRRVPTGWEVAFEPWFSARLAFRCATLHLDDAPVEGDGAWIQDDLHGARPVPPGTDSTLLPN